VLAFLSYHPIVRVHLGPLSVSPHGVGIALGFFLGARRFVPTMTAQGVPEETVYSMVTRAAIGAFIGARLAYVVNHVGDYQSVLEVFEVWKGGISLLGGFFGAVIAGLPRMKAARLSFWKVMDAAAPAMVIGVIVGRIGDLIVGDHLGKPTRFFLGYRCPPLNVATASDCGATHLVSRTPGLVVHQTALYDLMSALVLFGVLTYVVRKVRRYDGFVILVFSAWYGCMRILEDFLRADVRRFGLTGSQWTAVATVALSLWTLAILRRTPKWGRWDLRTEPEPAETEAPDSEAPGPEVATTEPAAPETVGSGPAELAGSEQPQSESPEGRVDQEPSGDQPVVQERPLTTTTEEKPWTSASE